ncbi:MAG: ATP-binding protein [Acidobacteriota bacterium]
MKKRIDFLHRAAVRCAFLRRLTLANKLAIPFSISIAAISVFIYLYLPSAYEKQMLRALSEKCTSIVSITSFGIAPAFTFDDTTNFNETIESLRQDPAIAFVVFITADGRIAASEGLDEAERAQFRQPSTRNGISSDGRYYIGYSDVRVQKQRVGELFIGMSLKQMHADSDAARLTVALASLAFFIIGVVLVVAISSLVTKPLASMVRTAESISAGDFSSRAPVESEDEVGHLAGAFNTMLDRLHSAYVELESNNQKLEERVNERTAQLKREVKVRQQSEAALQQAQKLESLGTLAGGIAHDFNNLLAMILGSAELLRIHAAAYPQLKKYVDRIVEASERGASISRQLLIFSRPDQSQFKPASLQHILAEFGPMLTHFLPKSIEIEMHIETGEFQVLGDTGQIHQALLNLVLNAADAMSNSGRLTIVLRVVEASELPEAFDPVREPFYAALSVADTGEGMSESVMKKIFDPFFSTKPKGKGTGLGLAMVHGIMKHHRGFIDVQSEPGMGTTFTLFFPLAPGASVSLPPSAHAAPPEP